jgi:translocation and assembly module TamA
VTQNAAVRVTKRWGPPFLLLLSLTCFAAEPERHILCPNLIVEGSLRELSPGLSGAETRLVCGDRENPSWKTIPLAQARFHLKTFLESRGLLHPEFSEEKPGTVLVKLGAPTYVTSLESHGMPAEIRLDRKRKIVGAKLTPGLLSELENWAIQRVRALGFACPTVKGSADPDTGAVLLDVKTGEVMDLNEVLTVGIDDTDPGIFRRFDAFQTGERYNADLLAVTESRISQNGLTESSHFSTTCDASGAKAKQELVPGPPRLLLLGAGLDTEGLFKVKASWKNTRMGYRASQLSFTASASTIQQNLQAQLDAYVFPHATRPYWTSRTEAIHDNEQFYQYASLTAQSGLATTWDGTSLGLQVASSPSLSVYHTISGTGPSDTRYLALETLFTLTTHDFEFFRGNPQTGTRFSMLVDFGAPPPVSDVVAQRLGVTAQQMFNLGGFDPPLFVLGFRGGFATIFSPARPGPNTELPAAFRQYLGGSTDLRGYGRQELPGPDGGMTSFFIDTELRLANELPLRLDPFIFLDLGMIGTTPGDFDRPLFYSPGLGLRWQSPIGSIRTTIAHGLPKDVKGHWQFYLAFGEEF